MLDLLQNQRFRQFLSYVVKASAGHFNQDCPLNMSVSLSVAFTAEAHRAEGQF